MIRLTEAEEMVERRMEELAKAELEVGMVLAMIPDKTINEYMVKRYLDCGVSRVIAVSMGFSSAWGSSRRKGDWQRFRRYWMPRRDGMMNHKSDQGFREQTILRLYLDYTQIIHGICTIMY